METRSKENSIGYCWWSSVISFIFFSALIGLCSSEDYQANAVFQNGELNRDPLPFEKQFGEFMLRFNKHYENKEEYQIRYNVFVANMLDIQRHNAEALEGTHKFTLAMGKFDDWTDDELKRLRGSVSIPFFDKVPKLEIDDVEVPALKNWTKEGCVTPVKNQLHCSSCWAFGAIAGIESANCMKTNKLVQLSEQQLTDCVYEGYNCDRGGNEVIAYNYLLEKGGMVDTEESYPYDPYSPTAFEKCHYNKSNVGGIIRDYKALPSGDEEKLKIAVATLGPIVVAIDARPSIFRRVTDGVIDVSKYPGDCNDTSYVDHVVLVVGYGTTKDTKEDYWIVKNSWGLNVGYRRSGYWLMSRNKNNQCNIAKEPVLVLA